MQLISMILLLIIWAIPSGLGTAIEKPKPNILYNLKVDLEEKIEVSDEFPQKVEELKKLLEKQREDAFTVKR